MAIVMERKPENRAENQERAAFECPTTMLTSNSSSKPKRPPKPKAVNPVEAAVKSWVSLLPADLLEALEISLEQLLSHTPKRWVVYPPMVLLPSGSFEDDSWTILVRQAPPQVTDNLWILLLKLIEKREGKGTLSHLAINSGIPLHVATVPTTGQTNTADEEHDAANRLRTPSGMTMLYGNFGPSLSPTHLPSEQDFKDAFWVSSKQNGITQIWAPRYTMFSRGNVKEKARILDFHTPSPTLQTRVLEKKDLARSTAVDLYAGIGYFVFSYVKMGMKSVIGWEINPWSVEGLRRGTIANGWSVKILGTVDDLKLHDEQVIILLEDNSKAVTRIRSTNTQMLGQIKHVNCGLLPTSEMTWRAAIDLLKTDGWLHLHENVGIHDIQMRSLQIEDMFCDWLKAEAGGRSAKVEHVERVKTFAPGVWHCVFDVIITTEKTSQP